MVAVHAPSAMAWSHPMSPVFTGTFAAYYSNNASVACGERATADGHLGIIFSGLRHRTFAEFREAETYPCSSR